MIEFGLRREYDIVSAGAQLEAEVDIVESNGKLFRKTPYFFKCFTPY